MEENKTKTQLIPSTSVAQPNSNNPRAEVPLAIGPYDILFYIFRHKKKIILFTLLGLTGAVTALLTIKPDPVYKSYAKLLVDYVITRHMADDIGTEVSTGKNVVDAELEIFTSWDLALKVAEEIGPEKILSEADKEDISLQVAAASIQRRIGVGNKKGSRVITISYEDKDPELVVDVLNEFVKQYFIKHLEVHRSGNAFQQATQRVNDIQWELSKVEEELTKLRAEYGIISLEEQLKALLMQRTEINTNLTNIMSELVTADARFSANETLNNQSEEVGREENNESNPNSLPKPASNEDISAYRRILARIDALNLERIEILNKYKEESVQAKTNERYLNSLNEEKITMLKKNPELAGNISPALSLGENTEMSSMPLSPRSVLEPLKAKMKFLEERKKEIDEQYASIVSVEPKIKSLQTQINRLKDEYDLAFAAQQETLSDQSLFTSDPYEIPNIDVIQYPSAALDASGSKIAFILAAGFAGGGIVFGVAWALLVELFIDTTIKRASEIKLQLHMPLMLSIPMLGIDGSPSNRIFWPWRNKKRKQIYAQLPVWDTNHFIRPYADAIRDRTDYEFEVNNVKRKPKLIALASFSDDVGTSTLAASLAASFTEVIDAKVLFINLSECNDYDENNQAPEDQSEKAFVYQEFLQDMKSKEQEKNLFVTKVSIYNQKTNKFMSKRLQQILPQLRQSNFDYVILDMPVISPVSPIISIAYLMDKTILVVGAEKTTRNDLKNNYEDLIKSNAKVSIVLNKIKRSLPLWLQR